MEGNVVLLFQFILFGGISAIIFNLSNNIFYCITYHASYNLLIMILATIL
ncbi:MAG TPA: hypothetical protein DIW15_01395 [Bavariicoccus seileri]|uniref:Uncharacterized protein n=1 Tax=Bavariicoccus seileri TaxID=549685 RepID=A0A3D4S3H1_9ENTE|nr:hypothetical protein [Bavariicoccus seileri]